MSPNDTSVVLLEKQVQQLEEQLKESQAKIKEYEGVRPETIDELVEERNKFKTLYQNEMKKANNQRVTIESQK